MTQHSHAPQSADLSFRNAVARTHHPLGRIAVLTSPLWLAFALTGCGAQEDGEVSAADDPAIPEELSCDGADTFDPAECPASYPEWACVVHVDGEAATSGDGWSWQSPVRTVQEGIDRAHCGATRSGLCSTWQVWVKEGRYFVHQGCDSDTVRLRAGVEVYGGFVGVEDRLTERDWATHETILDGRDGPDATAHVRHVVLGADDATVDGVTITGGLAGGSDEPTERCGAGMLNVQSSPVVQNCTFRDNVAFDHGGGMANLDRSSPTVAGCQFEENQAAQSGGAMANRQESEPDVSNSAFVGNLAGDSGGAVSSHESALQVTGCTFRDNEAVRRGGGMSSRLGSATVTGATFVGNLAHKGGGLDLEHCAATVTDSTFAANDTYFAVYDDTEDPTGQGAGLWIGGGTVSLVGNRVVDNTAFHSGGGLYATGGAEVELINAVVAGNQAGVGAGLASDGAAALSVVNCTVVGNVAEDSGGGIVGFDDLTVANSILWHNLPDQVAAVGTHSLSVTFSNVAGGHAGQGNLGSDLQADEPRFGDVSGGDLTLLDGSPGIDAADGAQAPATDLAGHERVDDPSTPNGSACGAACADMGAFEFQPGG